MRLRDSISFIYALSLQRVLFVMIMLCALGCENTTIEVPESPYSISDDSFEIQTIADGFNIPFGIAIVQENEYYVTERLGKLFHIKAGAKTQVKGVPKSKVFDDIGIPAIKHGGLMDISLHPNFKENSWLYLAYLGVDDFARVDRFKIENNRVSNRKTIFKTRQTNKRGSGMRIVWEDDVHFFLNVGGTVFTTSKKPILTAQNLEEDSGKIHRIKDDGSIPIDNPVFKDYDAPSTIWSYGHRDSQGLVYDKSNNTLYGLEHGPKGGDEFNIIKKGGNYGWPIFTYGIHYNGVSISTITEKEAETRTILPEHYWTVPSKDGGQAIAPACLLKLEGSSIQEWNNHFLMGSLAYKRLMKFNRETGETFGLNIEGRVRTIKQLPSGDLIALLERNDLNKSNGRIIKITS